MAGAVDLSALKQRAQQNEAGGGAGAAAGVELTEANFEAEVMSRSNEVPVVATNSWAMRFQWPGGVSVPAPSAQNCAIRDCSGVREEPTAAPNALTS